MSDFHKNRTRLLVDTPTRQGVILRKGTLVHRISDDTRPIKAGGTWAIYTEMGTFHAEDVQVEKRVGEKYVILERGEGPLDTCDQPVVVKTFEEASKVLATWARTAPAKGGSDKTDAMVVWHDGETYEASVELKRDHSFGYDLRAHIRSTLTFYAGERKPAHLTQTQYDDYLKRQEAEHPTMRQDAAEALTRYDI